MSGEGITDAEEAPGSQSAYQYNMNRTYPLHTRTAPSQPAQTGFPHQNLTYSLPPTQANPNPQFPQSYAIPHNMTPAQYSSLYYNPSTYIPQMPVHSPQIPSGYSPQIPPSHAPQMHAGYTPQIPTGHAYQMPTGHTPQMPASMPLHVSQLSQTVPPTAYFPKQSIPDSDEKVISQKDDFNSLIREIGIELAKDPKVVGELKFILSDKFTREEIDKLSDVESILNKMMEKKLLSENNVCYLEDYLRISYESLSKRLIQFRQSCDKPMKPVTAPVGVPEEQPLPIPQKIQSVQRPPVESGVYYYPMDKRPHGLCAIFNNTNFTTERLGRRKGSEIDRDRLENLFKHLQYNIELYNDLTADGMLTKMEEISQRNHKDFDSFICCILTHGADNDALYGSDGQEINLRKVMSHFYGKNARTLFGKPKIFFIQACRGDLEDMGFSSGFIGEDSLEGGEKVHYDSSDLPDTADFLIAFPTSSGFVSWRSHNEGTWYIKALCDQLALCHNQHDLMTILTMVNGKVAERRTSEGHKQMPAPVTHLRKLVYIRT